jgi:hypothetical protein
MSRSYKKTHYAGLRKSRFSKNQANRRIRKLIPSAEEEWYDALPKKGKAFKKFYDSYDICDYYDYGFGVEDYIKSWTEFQESFESSIGRPMKNKKTEEELRNRYYENYVRK